MEKQINWTSVKYLDSVNYKNLKNFLLSSYIWSKSQDNQTMYMV